MDMSAKEHKAKVLHVCLMAGKLPWVALWSVKRMECPYKGTRRFISERSHVCNLAEPPPHTRAPPTCRPTPTQWVQVILHCYRLHSPTLRELSCIQKSTHTNTYTTIQCFPHAATHMCSFIKKANKCQRIKKNVVCGKMNAHS